MKELLLIKHGGASKRGALHAAQRVGDPVVADRDPNLPVALHLLHVGEISPAAILDAVKAADMHPSACLTYVDPAVAVTAEVAAQLELPGLPPATAAILKDKHQMRARLEAAGVPTPRYRLVTTREEVERAATDIGCPVVLKPVSGAYSLGVVRIDTADQAQAAFRTAALEFARSEFARFFLGKEPPRWIVEEYLQGPEISVELLGDPDAPQVLAIHEKVISEAGGHFREDRFVTAPWKLTPSQIAQVSEEAVRVAKALKFTIGVGSLEMRVTDHGVYAIELQACPIGGMVSTMVERTTGVNLHQLHAQVHVRQPQGHPVRAHDTGKRCAMDVLYADRPGVFRITGVDSACTADGVIALDVPATQGRVVEPYAEYLGFLCTEAGDAPAAVARLDRARARLQITVDEP